MTRKESEVKVFRNNSVKITACGVLLKYLWRRNSGLMTLEAEWVGREVGEREEVEKGGREKEGMRERGRKDRTSPL